MFLSRVSLISSAQSCHELAKLQQNGAYASHQLIWKLFTHDKARQFIYREEQSLGGMPQFFVLSEEQPHADSPLFQVQCKAFNPLLKSDQQLAYKLRVNPTVCTTDKNGKQQRHDVMMYAKHQAKNEGVTDASEIKAAMEQAAISWLANEKRLNEWGVSLDCQPDIVSYQQHQSRKKSGHLVQFSSVDFQGLLTVKEPDVFLKKYKEGFGRAKAMGCGLMLIRPV